MQHCPTNASGMPGPAPVFYRTTQQGKAPLAIKTTAARCAYLHDVLRMCERGMWERDLRQFMPPASLRASVDSLLALGLIETTDSATG